MDDGFTVGDTVDPNSGLIDGIMHSFSIRLIKFGLRSRRPRHERERLPVFFDEMIETDFASRESFDFIERLLYHFVDGMPRRVFPQHEPQTHERIGFPHF
jgi:hypothetical protein